MTERRGDGFGVSVTLTDGSTDFLRKSAADRAATRERRVSEYGEGLGGALHELILAEENHSLVSRYTFSEAFYEGVLKRTDTFALELAVFAGDRKVRGRQIITAPLREYREAMEAIRNKREKDQVHKNSSG